MKKQDRAKQDVEAARQNGNKQQQQQVNGSGKISQQQHQLQIQQEAALVADKHKNNKMSYCFQGRSILLLSMAISIIIITVLVAIITMYWMDNEDQCFNNLPFQQQSYKFFSTKTTYSTASDYLNKSTKQQTSNYYDNDLPDIFSKSDSLKTLNQRLIGPEFGCKVRQFHYIGRHAARYPNKLETDNINKNLNNIQARIDLAKFSTSNNNDKLNKSECFNPLTQYKQWISFMEPENGNLILEQGAEETLTIAQRLKSILPDLFDAKLTKIEFGTTDELRTAQTALIFMKQIENFALDFCNLDQFPAESASKESQDIKSDECFKLLLKNYHKDKLRFHEKCESYHKEDFSILHNLALDDPRKIEFISNSVSKKLKLAKEDYLDSKETKAIYKACKYESAFRGSSIWCNLFSDNELKFFEYIEDVDDFFNNAYGHPDKWKSACPVTTELIKSFKTARASMLAQQDPIKPEAFFYFTHSQVIQRILAASVDLEQDGEYSVRTVLKHFQAGTAPSKRQWRTSLFTPFSANIAFTLYECPRQSIVKSSNEEFTEIDVSESPLKVVASLNEQPIMLDGCSDYVCDLNKLLSDSRITTEKRCKLEDICRKKIVIT